MTPKEKAIYLVNKFIDYVSSETMLKHHDENRQLSNAKKCALMTVDEIIDAEIRSGVVRACEEKDVPPLTPREVNLGGSPRRVSYWKRVKAEIENYEAL